jgi:dynein heavy chain 1
VWHQETLNKFGALLGNEMSQLHSQVREFRSELEAASTSVSVAFRTKLVFIQDKVSEKQVEVYREEQRILGEQGFQFPQNCWLNIDDIEGEWRAFNKIIKQKESAIQTLVASLQTTQQPYPWQLSSTLDNLLKAIRYGK